MRELSIAHTNGIHLFCKQLLERFCVEKAKWFCEVLCDTFRNSSEIACIKMGIPPDRRIEEGNRNVAPSRGWRFLSQRGDMELIEQLFGIAWLSDELLVVVPGWGILFSHDGLVLSSEKAEP